MTPDQRLDAYYAQNGAENLTAAQNRRYQKKYCRALAVAERAAERDSKPATS